MPKNGVRVGGGSEYRLAVLATAARPYLVFTIDSMENPRHPHLYFNFIVNVLDGAFFGLALGFASFGTNIPIFVKLFTDKALLIGLIPAIHAAGLRFPALFTARMVSRRKRYKPFLLACTVQERLPFLGLAVVAWFMNDLSPGLVVVLIFLLLIWQGLGGGFGLVAWQSMLAKVLSPRRLGTFYGAQMAAMNVLASLSALAAGVILDRSSNRVGFALVFLLSFLALIISFIMVAQTRELDNPPVEEVPARGAVQISLKGILQRDVNFRWFLVVSVLAQLATMCFAFYMVHVYSNYFVSKTFVGVLTSVSLIAAVLGNLVMGWIGDRKSHYIVLGFGLVCATLSALLAWRATSVAWFFPVVILSGVANVAVWTISMAMTVEFGRPEERQAYIGMANTLIAPATILAPIFGGWLADRAGYPVTFLASGVCGVLTILVFVLRLRDPRRHNIL
jgi:MFS family permease